jgi:hypothetical protein
VAEAENEISWVAEPLNEAALAAVRRWVNRGRAFGADEWVEMGVRRLRVADDAIVDLVTIRPFNLYRDLLDLIGQTDPSLAPEPSGLHAAACRWTPQNTASMLDAWNNTLVPGQPLPTIPLWLADNFAVPLELEATYEETCRILRIP